MSLLTTVIAVAVLAVCAFPYLKLEEGTLLYAVLFYLHGLFNSYVNVFADSALRPYGLIPAALLCVVNMFLAFRGSGLLSFVFRCTAFFSLYLLGTLAQGKDAVFEILSKLPDSYPYIAGGALAVSLFFLGLIHRIKRGYKEKPAKKEGKDDGEKSLPSFTAGSDIGPLTGSDSSLNSGNSGTDSESQGTAAPVFNLHISDEQINAETRSALNANAANGTDGKDSGSNPATASDAEKTTKIKYDYDPVKSRNALASLTAVEVPEFKSFPNYDISSSVSSINRDIYGVSERESRIRREAQERREAELEIRRREEEERLKRMAEEEERVRKEAEENRKRLQDLFKPRNLMKRLNEDAQAEKIFPTCGASVPDIDYGISSNANEKNRTQVVMPENPVPVSSMAPVFVHSNDIPVSQQIPVSQMPGRNAVQPAGDNPARGVKPETSVSRNEDASVNSEPSVFARAAEQAEADELLSMRRRKAELERKHLEELKELERQRREAEEATRLAEAELARTKAEMLRQREATKEVAAAESEETDDDGISEKAMAEIEAKANAPDLDCISGIAGLKSSAGGNPYLIDRQKFDYQFPPDALLKHYPVSARIYEDPENDPDGRIIVDTLRQFRIETSLIGVQHGPTFTLYELSLAKGIKVSTVLNLSENIAMDLSVQDVRILAPIPGKPAIGVEVPNKKRDTIGFDVMMPALRGRYYKIPMVLGNTITGESIVIDLTKTPHLLVAGTTGSGKSVCINSLICSILYTKTPKDVRMILVDPKMVELSLYNGIPHLLTPVITDAKKSLKVMNFVVEEMERRMALFSAIGAKKIDEYNDKIREKKLLRVKLPYIVVIIDEFADLMLAVGKELETSIKRITAVARFCGIHLVLATQRPSTDVITGVIKSNIPTQIAFAVSNSINSRIIIDQTGAEKLLGRGDMLYNSPESRQPVRIQGAYIDSEIEDIVSFAKTQGEPDYIDESYFEDDDEDENAEDSESAQNSAAEDLFSKGWKIVSDRGEASASYLQRRLGIGYNRAANLIEQMEDAGYIGPARGSKPREILKLYGSD